MESQVYNAYTRKTSTFSIFSFLTTITPTSSNSFISTIPFEVIQPFVVKHTTHF